ncbi:hypothetical protein ACJRO7_002231 [Eucalyptus globulus]|uniref:Uncharacterized protein n=1 Tax=Eucalyptus globulus TaxID=34317 RepID=A0ABD3LZ97_EUCGL
MASREMASPAAGHLELWHDLRDKVVMVTVAPPASAASSASTQLRPATTSSPSCVAWIGSSPSIARLMALVAPGLCGCGQVGRLASRGRGARHHG